MKKQTLLLVSIEINDNNKKECSMNCDFLTMEDVNDSPYFLCCLFGCTSKDIESYPVRCEICIEKFGV